MYTLHRFRYSPYARKVQRLLEVLGLPHRVVEVPYGNREDLARLTGGYVHVPVLRTPTGEVIVESRVICARLIPEDHPLLPRASEGAIWAYHDHVEGPIEDVLFRLATPGVRDAWPTAWERALYTLIKERRYGAGCVDAWKADREGLLARGRELLAPTARTLAERPFATGDAPTLADLALYGQYAMLREADPELLPALGAAFVAHAQRIETWSALPAS